jgi:hypothetical protein
MKYLIALTLLTSAFLSAATAADKPASLPDEAKKLRKSGIKNEADLTAYLLAAPTWTWQSKEGDAAVKFEADGVATHTLWVGKWTATSAHEVVIRVPDIGLHTLTFSNELTSFKGIWNSKNPITGKFQVIDSRAAVR